MNYIKVAFFLYFLFHLGPTIAADQFLSNTLSEEALQESKRDISAAILAALGNIFSDVSELSNLNNCIPPTPSLGRIDIAFVFGSQYRKI